MQSIAENVAKTRFANLQPLRAKVKRSERIDKEDHGNVGTPPERWRRCVAFFFPLSVPFLHAVLSFWGLDGQIPTHSLTRSLTRHPPPHNAASAQAGHQRYVTRAPFSSRSGARAGACSRGYTGYSRAVVTSNCHNTSIRHHAVAIIAKLTEVLIES